MGVKVRQKVKGKNNPWWVFINHNGRRKAKKVGSKAAAEELARAIQVKLKKGELHIEDEKKLPLFKDYAQEWLEGYVKNTCKHSTWINYEKAIRNHLEPVWGNKTLDEIFRADIKDFIYQKLNEGLSANTVCQMKNILSGIFSYAFEDELLFSNPASRTGKLIRKKDKEDINPYTAEEVSLFLETCQEHYPRYYPLFLCGFRTGMRIGELLALRPGDIDFNGRFIEVRRSYVCGRITTPKNGKIRKVDMTPYLAETLKQLRIERKKETLMRGWKEVPEWVFCNEAGNIIDISSLRKRVFSKCQGKAGLRRIRLHDMRHSYATIRISKGDNIADVSKQLGHSSVKITTDIYYHWLPGENKSQVDELDSIGKIQLVATHTQPREARLQNVSR